VKERETMVYCSECGTDNEDNAEFCVKCGAALYPKKVVRRPPKKQDECFGLPHGGAIFSIILGLIIILWGVREFLGWSIDFGPFLIIIIGILIVGGAIYGITRRKS
jgi:hypothetical protein